MMSDIARDLECAKAKEEVESLRQRVKELEEKNLAIAASEGTAWHHNDRLEAELAALKQSQGEPVGIIETLSNRERRCGPVIWIADINALPNGTKLYTSAPTIPEGCQLVRSTITPEVSLRMDELRDADTTNAYLYEVILAAAAPKPEGA